MRKWEYNGVEFKSGHKVMVMSLPITDDPNGMGVGKKWFNNFQEDMIKYLLNIYEIDFIDQEGVHFVEPDGVAYFSFPLNVLMNLTVAGAVDTHGNLIAEKFKEVVWQILK